MFLTLVRRTETAEGVVNLPPPCNSGTGRDTDMISVSTPHVFGVEDFNGVVADFVRHSVRPEIKMADVKTEVVGNHGTQTRNVEIKLVFQVNHIATIH